MDPFRESLSSILLDFCHLLSTLFLSKIVQPLTAILSIAPHPTPVAPPQSNGFIPGPLAYTVSPEFPTSAFSSYYFKAAPTQEPQPAVYDPILNITFPYNLTDPDIIPSVSSDPVSFPEPLVNISFPAADILFHSAYSNISAIIENDSIASNCSKCLAALSIGKAVAQAIPDRIPDLLIRLCSRFELYPDAKCVNKYAARSYGATWAQVLAFANVSDLDGYYICNDIKTLTCPSPTISPFNVSRLFPKPRPLNATIPKASGNRVKVLHLSDFHLDPRYSVASEANCSTGFCCRTNIPPANSSIDHVLFPAPLYGAYKCDTPYYLALAALQAIPPLTGTSHNDSDIAWTIYTGDLVSHDSQNQLSRAYLEYTETSVFALFKKYIGGPVFAVLGNHDSNPNGVDAPHSLPGPLGEQFSWNYNHIASLWEQEGWVDSSAANKARLHYGAYSIRNHLGLRIITLNTDFWLKSNPFNYINSTNPDVSGTLHFLIQELQAAEDANDRVWILGHVPSGWDGNNALKNPANLFHLIIDRYSPHVIANIFFGHTHQDQITIFYRYNDTLRTGSTALTTAWIGPSITPLQNLNSGFRMYEVDTQSFEIYNAYTWISDVASFQSLNVSATGPTFSLEYSTRDAYKINWPPDSPLNAEYWHAVTEAMESNRSLIQRFNTYQGKSSGLAPNCSNDECAAAKICYMRSGSAALGADCPQGYGSVQNPYEPKT